MKETGFKKGDIVQLKSGGPQLTVGQIHEVMGEPYVRCTWWNEDESKFSEYSFSPECLTNLRKS
jgi:uncharacterized protein YodC (DUF2158 family)